LSGGPSRRLARSPLIWLSALLIAYLAVPLVVFVARSAGHPGEGFSTPGLFPALATSAEAATISTLLVGVFGVPLAYVLARWDGRLASVAGIVIMLPLALPPLMSGVVLLYVVGPYTFLGQLTGNRLTESVAGIVLAQSFVSSPFLIIAARSAFRAVDPKLEEVAATSGLHPLARFSRVAVPLAVGGIRAGLLLTWLRAFGEYGATVMLSYHPYSLPVFTYVQFSAVGLPAAQATSLLALGLAAVVIALTLIPFPTRRRKTTAPVAPSVTLSSRPPIFVAFDLSMTAGAFQLQLAHRARSHRLAIVGPSGAGKSLTLRCLAGLLPGDVSFSGQPVGPLPPEQRRVGYVPQGDSLMPNLTAWENAVFGPRARPELAAWWFSALGLTALEDHLPSQLSGGQRQRAALARAFSSEPSVVLLDEPFTGLDAPQRAALVEELRRLQRSTNLSSVLVTHDAKEAGLLADELVVISSGRLAQAGPLGDVLDHPATPEVAGLLGMRNILPGVAYSAGSLLAAGAVIETRPHGVAPGEPLTWSVHPRHIAVSARSSDGALPATVADLADLGAYSWTRLALAGSDLEVEAELTGEPLPVASACWVTLPADAVLVWPAEGWPAGTGAPSGKVVAEEVSGTK
jgi:ABC-type sulfate/molybdate transport systems ATPase subunit/ABC-type sulfate transport system permease component